MRITCPNCAAEYKLDNDALQENGRNVQCTICGEIWFADTPQDLLLLKYPMNAGAIAQNWPPFETQRAQSLKVGVDPSVKEILQSEAQYAAQHEKQDSPSDLIELQASPVQQTAFEKRNPNDFKAHELRELSASAREIQQVRSHRQIAHNTKGSMLHIFFIGVLVAVAIISLLVVLYLSSETLGDVIPYGRVFFENIRYIGDQMRLAIQDLYYTGDSPGLHNFFQNFTLVFQR